MCIVILFVAKAAMLLHRSTSTRGNERELGVADDPKLYSIVVPSSIRVMYVAGILSSPDHVLA